MNYSETLSLTKKYAFLGGVSTHASDYINGHVGNTYLRNIYME